MSELPEFLNEDYDEIDYLIDNDTIELGRRYRTLDRATREFLLAYEDGEHDNPTAVRLARAVAALRVLVERE